LLIDREKLKNIIPAIAGKMKFRPAIVEKDYHLTVILNNVEELLTKKIVFKGGTLLNKAHLNYHRLSEDLDFTYNAEFATRPQRSKAITPIREKMPSFLKALDLTSDEPEGEGFDNSRQYVFKVKYPSVLMAKDDMIKIEISLRQPPIDKPVSTVVKHFYQDPFTGEDLFPSRKILSLSWKEAVAEKLKAAISRKDVAIRDYYDLWYISESGFDFCDNNFIKLFKRKVTDEGYAGDYKENFGLNTDKISILRKQIDGLLKPVIRSGEEFDLDKVLERFNVILQKM
jgi:predicted nucleotidyltransferase component of viral defense system